MKNQLSILKFILCILLILAVISLINEVIDFDLLHYKTFESWRSIANKKRGVLSQEAIQYSFYIIEFALFAFRVYLIYGISQLFFILRNVENKLYFNQQNIDFFKKIGAIFRAYVINVFILKAILLYISRQRNFNFMQLINNELILLFAAALAFHLLATIFERAKALQEENDLTV